MLMCRSKGAFIFRRLLDLSATAPPDADIQEQMRQVSQTFFSNPSALHGPGRGGGKTAYRLQAAVGRPAGL
jgi:cysteine sulfinate desulfinase/cysteine desulfurase-like protein